MIQIRKSEDRGHFDHGWLDTQHTFSFADYYDPNFMGFRSLRVINEDYVTGGQGFGTHPHRDMEIITYILEGTLEHKDSMGTGSIIQPGDAQRMTAGKGVTHSEFNHSKTEKVHLLQIWILPEKKGLEPSYEQKKIDRPKAEGRWLPIATPTGEGSAVKVHQDVTLNLCMLKPKEKITYEFKPGRFAWIQVARGSVKINGTDLKTGDGAAISGENKITAVASEPSELLLFDLN